MRARLTVLQLLLLVVLSAAVVVQQRAGTSAQQAPPATPRAAPIAPPPAPLPTAKLVPLTALSETVARPLFTANRRAPTKAVAVIESASDPAPPRHSFVLSAIVIADGERSALLRDPANGALIRVLQGERLAGWTLETVHSDRVVMVRDAERQEVTLRKFVPAPVRPAPAVPAGRISGSNPEAEPDSGAEAADLRRPRRPKRGPRRRIQPAETQPEKDS